MSSTPAASDGVPHQHGKTPSERCAFDGDPFKALAFSQVLSRHQMAFSASCPIRGRSCPTEAVSCQFPLAGPAGGGRERAGLEAAGGHDRLRAAGAAAAARPRCPLQDERAHLLGEVSSPNSSSNPNPAFVSPTLDSDQSPNPKSLRRVVAKSDAVTSKPAHLRQQSPGSACSGNRVGRRSRLRTRAGVRVRAKVGRSGEVLGYRTCSG